MARHLQLLALGLQVLLAGCNFDCGMEEVESQDCSCTGTAINAREFLITDFEPNGNNPNACNTFTLWRETAAAQASLKTDSSDLNSYACLKITGNNGNGPNNWTGAGLVFPFSNCEHGIDLSDYDLLRFEVRIKAGSQLQNLQVSLQDISRKPGPQRQVQTATFKLSTAWQTAGISLEEFLHLKTHETHLSPVDLRTLLELVTHSINDSTSPPVDGELHFDNLRFEKL